MTPATESGKVIGYESDYIDSLIPGSYEEICEGFDADDAKRHKSSKKYYALMSNWLNFFLYILGFWKKV